MKRIIIFLSISLSIMLYCIRSVYADRYYHYVWENTYIEVDVFSSIYDYINLPTATLYADNIKLGHPVAYLRGDATTQEEGIDTSKCGTYFLAYTAVSDIEEKIMVTFDVKDRIAPRIENVSQLMFPYSSKPDYSKFFSVVDNYDNNPTIIYNDQKVNYNVPGTYTMNVIASDMFNNVSDKEFEVIIYDLQGPKIDAIKELNIKYNSIYDPLEYFNAYDLVDGDCSNTIESSPLNTSIVGRQNVSISAYDLSGNKSYSNYVFNVLDNQKPIIYLTSDIATINIGDAKVANYEFFKKYIDRVYDNFDNLSANSVDIDYSSLKAIIGEYKIIYSVTDSSNNTASKEMIVNVVCDSVPEINITNINVYKGSTINYHAYFTVYDKYDGYITSLASVDDSNVNVNKKGTYFAIITVKNSNGKYNYQTIVVNVKEKWIDSYWWVFLIPVGLVGATISIILIIKRKKNII